MEELITSYGLPFHDFQKLLKRIDGVVTGSAALAMYLKQEGIDSGFVPNDIDIFIQERGESSVCSELTQFLRKYGFKKSDKFDVEEGGRSYYPELNDILTVDSYTNEAGKEIQIICLVDTMAERIEDYICTQFDLSICATWWDSERFHTLNPSLTKRKMMYRIDKPLVLLIDSKLDTRIEKYLLRGFTLVDDTAAA
jgi:hypothetical protein